jgi:hypothetical protein
MLFMMMMRRFMAKQAAEQAVVLLFGTGVVYAVCRSSFQRKGFGSSIFVGILLPFVNLLSELFCFLFIRKAQTH